MISRGKVEQCEILKFLFIFLLNSVILFMKIALFKNRSIISSLIKWQTRSEYSHAAILLDDKLIEAKEFDGVQVVHKLEVGKKCSVDIYEVEVSESQRTAIVDFLANQIGKGYDYTMVIRFLTRQQESRKSSGKWFCSELVFAAFEKAGITLLNNVEPWEVSPALLSITTEMVLVEQITGPQIRDLIL
jgi:hypothetical protein